MQKLFVLLFSFLHFHSAFSQYAKLHDFSSLNGKEPHGSLVSDGTFLYGTTVYGGINNNGTIFKIKADGTAFAKIFDFDDTNGKEPCGALFFDGVYLYGSTSWGGSTGQGVIFKIMPDGTGFSKLHDFGGLDGSAPGEGSLTTDGTFLYGTTANGGLNGYGVIYKIQTDGTAYNKIWDFNGSGFGNNPSGTLYNDGSYLYGMTTNGGTGDLGFNYGAGIIYKIKFDGTDFTKLLDFLDGVFPGEKLTSDGTFLYGMTKGGGDLGKGIIFKLMADGSSYSKLWNFSGAAAGSNPSGALLYDGNNLVGLTSGGGTSSLGNLFQIQTDGSNYTNLFDFSGLPEGSFPLGSVISDGFFLYGLTSGGGNYDYGTVFRYALNTGLGTVDLTNFVTVFPNPFNSHSEIFIGHNQKNAKVNITDVLGKTHRVIEFSGEKCVLEKEELLPGTYFFNITTGERSVTRKVIIY
jgi:uncharacterized repeat protein (TIGR03803 family)